MSWINSLPGVWHMVVERVLWGGHPGLRDTWPVLAIVVLGGVPVTRRWWRSLVTLVHEAGHAIVGLAVGRRFLGFVIERDLSGHAVTAGKERGFGRCLTTWAGYPAPALLGAGLVGGALRGWSGAVLAGLLVIILVLVTRVRSLRTAAVVLAVGAGEAALWWWGGMTPVGDVRAGVVAGFGVALLLGAWSSLGDVIRSRREIEDHQTLARLTILPAGLWLTTWVVVDLVATVLAVREVWMLLGA